MNRAQRRREARQKITIGENLIVTGTGQQIDLDRHPERNLPPKRDQAHRWIAIATFHVADPAAEGLKFLDQENLVFVGFGCYDCETPWGTDVASQPCIAAEAQ